MVERVEAVVEGVPPVANLMDMGEDEMGGLWYVEVKLNVDLMLTAMDTFQL